MGDIKLRLQAFKTALLLSAGLVLPEYAYAQDNAAGQGILEEVVVTAQRREENLQTIPVSVTAIAGEEMRARNVQDVNQLIGLVPGFTLRDAGETIQYNLRGYISTDIRASSDGPVAVYVDDVFMGATVMQQMQIFDVDRTEALRGPQGTLFGRNAVGGLIHFISKKPTDHLDGYGGLQYGSYDELIADGAVGGPIAPGLTGRIAFKYNYHGGWQENLSGGKRRSSKDAIAGRAQLRYEFTPNLKATLSLQLDHERNQYQGYSSLGTLNATATTLCSYRQTVAGECFIGGAPFSNVPAGTKSLATYSPTKIYSTLQSDPDNYDAQLGILRFDWDAGSKLQLSSITAFAHAKRSFIEDDNSTGLANNDDFNILDHHFSGRQISQELRASGEISSVKYVAGLFYLRSKKFSEYEEVNSSRTLLAYLAPHEELTTKTVAAFAQIEVPITPTITAIAGGRYTWERKTLDRTYRSGRTILGPEVTLPESSESVSRFTGKAGLQWTPNSDLMFYGTVSSGFKSGEFPSDAANTPLELVDPETIMAYELGAKTSLFDGHVRFNIAGFINKIKDKQSVTSIRDATTGNIVNYLINFGDVDQKGFEAELIARPIPNLTIGATVAYVDNSIDPVPGVLARRMAFFNSYTLDGNELPGAPPWQETVYADLRLPVDMPGTLNLRVDWRFQSFMFWGISNDPYEVEPAYDVGDVRLTYTSPSEKWSLTAFATNVTNTKYATVNFSFGGSDVLTVQWGRPRMLGIRGAVNF